MLRKLSFMFAALLILTGCEIIQSTGASKTDLRVTSPAGGTEVSTDMVPGDTGCSLSLDPPGPYNIQVTWPLDIKVIFSCNGVEGRTESLDAVVTNPTVLEREDIDGRIVRFRGLAIGSTSIFFTANSLSIIADVTITVLS